MKGNEQDEPVNRGASGFGKLPAALCGFLFRDIWPRSLPPAPPPRAADGEAKDTTVRVPVGPEVQGREPLVPLSEVRGLVTDVATSLWRVRKKVSEPDGESAEKLRTLRRHVESAWDALERSEVEVRDHTGEGYVAGMALKVIAFQPTQGVESETIVETIKPTVFYKHLLIQQGEVIVAIPKSPANRQGEEGSR